MAPGQSSQQHRPSLHDLPMECLDLILHHLSPGSLYMLMQVCKTLVAPCVNKLYSAPLQTVASDKLDRLVHLIFRVTPQKSVFAKRYKEDHKRSLSSFPPAALHVDYLSFIQTFLFNRALPMSGYLVRGTKADVHSMLLLAACGHRLSGIRKLSVSASILSHFCRPQTLEAIEELEILFSVDRWKKGGETVETRDLQNARAFVKTLCEHRRSRRGTAAPIKVEYQEVDTWGYGWCTKWERGAKQLFQGLDLARWDSLCGLWKGPNTDWLRFRVLPESIDLAKIQCIQHCIVDTKSGAEFPPEKPRPFPDGGKAAILQQCRSLRRLGISMSNNDLDCNWLFKWAVEERRAAMSKAAASTDSVVPTPWTEEAAIYRDALVPLEELFLRIETHFLQVGFELASLVHDVAFAFGQTLRSLVIYERPLLAKWIIDLSWFRDMPELRELRLSVRSFESYVTPHDLTPFSGCPKLESIYLEERDLYQAHRHPIFPMMYLTSSLRHLSVTGPVVHRFNQESLESATELRVLKMQETPQTGYDWFTTTFSWQLHYWTFTRLEELDLQGGPVAGHQLLLMLAKYCPGIKALRLEGKLTSPMYGPLCPVLRINGQEGTESEAVAAQNDRSSCFSFPSVTLLSLKRWRLSDEMLTETLPSIFPNLQVLEIKGCVVPSSLTSDDFFAAFKNMRWFDNNIDFNT